MHTQVEVLDDRAERGVFLGYEPLNSTYKVGLWREDDRTKTGLRFLVAENRSVKFAEQIAVSDINHLKPDSKGTYMQFPLTSQLGDYVDFPEDVGPAVEKASHGSGPGAGAAESENDSSSESEPNDDDADVEPVPKQPKVLDGSADHD